MNIVPLILVAVIAAGFTLWPLLTNVTGRIHRSRQDTALGRLELRKATLLDNIADLDFEHAMGKLADEDHQALRSTLEAQAMAVLEQIEVLQQAGVVEAEPQAKPQRFCHQCGEGLPQTARFCPSCGTSLQVAELSA